MTQNETSSLGMGALLAVMRRLREPEKGCPWDLEQSFATIAPYTVEEAYEVADAIMRQDMAALKEELGDLLFQVVFHAQMADEAGYFSFGDVVALLVEKMRRRHPHVFGTASVADADAQTKAWEDHKAAERRAKSTDDHLLSNIPVALPALRRALKIQNRLKRVGFDWPNANGPLEKLKEEIGELDVAVRAGDLSKIGEELGDILFTCVNVARALKVDPEASLHAANEKVARRVRLMEDRLAAQGRTMEQAEFDELEQLWTEAKTR